VEREKSKFISKFTKNQIYTQLPPERFFTYGSTRLTFDGLTDFCRAHLLVYMQCSEQLLARVSTAVAVDIGSGESRNTAVPEPMASARSASL